MKGMIFAAGIGSRLRPLTDTCPKCLIEVGGRPMLEYVIDSMRRAGIGKIAVNVHHHAAMVARFLRGRDFGVEIAVSDETDMLLDTGGGLLKALDLLGRDEAVMVHNADVLTDYPLQRLVEIHRLNGSDATLLVRNTHSARALLTAGDGRLRGWENSATGLTRGFDPAEREGLRPVGFAGVHILGPVALEALERYGAQAGAVFGITPFYADNCNTLGIATTGLEGAAWFDIGKPDTLAAARAYMATS